MKITCEDKIYTVNEKIQVIELLKKQIEESEYDVVGCIVNNEYQNLQYILKEDANIRLIRINSKEGMRIYRNTATYIMQKAFEELYPESKFSLNYRIANDTFCEIDNMKVTPEILKNVENKMKEIIDKNLEIKLKVMTRQEAQEFYAKNDVSKGRLQLDVEENQEIKLYYCENYYNYCFEELANKTGCVKRFALSTYKDGFLLRYPDSRDPRKIPQEIKIKKLSWAMNEYDDIHKILDVNTVFKINRAIKEDKIKELIMLAESLHEKKIAEMADKIARNKNIKIILIAGPSSSGKTTFAQRLGIQLKINKIKPVTISVDNYFVEREQTPKDKNGEYDFESIEAIDLELFNKHLTQLLNGEEIEMPQFDFKVGTKKYYGNKMKLNEDEVLVIEGIHCLNDKLTQLIPMEQKYKIYISALTVLSMDRYNKISTTDTRLIRRIVRDYQFRGYTAEHTLNSWHKVKGGEEKNIYPFQDSADVIFNTSLVYELGVLKDFALPLLKQIPRQDKMYPEAQRLINMLKYFEPIPKEYVPTNSLLSEFIGGGNFKY